MKEKALKEGLFLMQEAIKWNVSYILNINCHNREKVEKARKNFVKWAKNNPQEYEYIDDNLIDCWSDDDE